MAGDGTALGQLNEKGAFRQVTQLIPEAPEEEKLALLRAAARLAASYGLTGVHNMDGDAAQFARYARLEAQGELPLRIYAPYSVSPETTAVRFVEEATALKALYQSDKVRLGAAKFFMDGVIESFTALMVSPYANRPEVTAEGLFSLERFTEMAILADQMGLQIAVHAIGDGAVRRVLDGYAAVRRHNGPRDSRHRIEHLELRPDIGYFPYWLDCVRPEQYGDAFAWRTLLEQGVPLTLGSDWPVTSLQVATGIEAAVNRTAWAPGLRNQALTLEETLAGYTVTPAWVEFREHAKGRLRPGMLADLVLLDRDWLHANHAELGALRPQMTICDGAVTYAA
jgi:predicted amidohydrolase YtcJ